MSQLLRAKNRPGKTRFHIGDWGELLSTTHVGRRQFIERAAASGFDGIDWIMPSNEQVTGAFSKTDTYLNPTDFVDDDALKREVDWTLGLADDFLLGDGVAFVWAHDPFDDATNKNNGWVKCCVDALRLMSRVKKLGGLAEGAGLRIDSSVQLHKMTLPRDQWLGKFVPRAQYVGRVAKALGFPVYMEFEPCWPTIHDRVAVLETLDALGDCGVDVMYDFAHAYCLGQAAECQPAGASPYPDHIGFINDLAKRIRKIHIADTTGKLHGQQGHAPTGEHAIPGQGILSANGFAPMRAIIRELAAKVPNFGKFGIWSADVCMVDADALQTCFPAVVDCMRMLHKEVKHLWAA